MPRVLRGFAWVVCSLFTGCGVLSLANLPGVTKNMEEGFRTPVFFALPATGDTVRDSVRLETPAYYVGPEVWEIRLLLDSVPQEQKLELWRTHRAGVPIRFWWSVRHGDSTVEKTRTQRYVDGGHGLPDFEGDRFNIDTGAVYHVSASLTSEHPLIATLHPRVEAFNPVRRHRMGYHNREFRDTLTKTSWIALPPGLLGLYLLVRTRKRIGKAP